MKYFNFINFFIYQAAWFLAALYPNQSSWLILVLIVLHFLLSPSKLDDFKLLNIAVMGCVIDGTLIHFSVLQTSDNTLPTTLILLWCIFAFTFNHCLRWMRDINLTYVALIGLVLGPASYYAALKLNTFDTSLTHSQFISLYAVIWAVILPLCIKYCTSVKVIFDQDTKEVKQ